jgi:hypothetical protein
MPALEFVDRIEPARLTDPPGLVAELAAANLGDRRETSRTGCAEGTMSLRIPADVCDLLFPCLL